MSFFANDNLLIAICLSSLCIFLIIFCFKASLFGGNKKNEKQFLLILFLIDLAPFQSTSNKKIIFFLSCFLPHFLKCHNNFRKPLHILKIFYVFLNL